MPTTDLPLSASVPSAGEPSHKPTDTGSSGGRSHSRLMLFFRTVIYLSGRDGIILVSSISFSFLLSVFPFIVLLLSLTHYLEWNELNGIIFDSLYYFFPVSQEFIVHNLRVYTQPIQGMHAFSFLLLFWGVSAFFFSLEAGLDSAYRVSEPRRLSVSQFLGSVMVVLFGLVALICISFLRVARMITQDVLELEPELSSSIEVANYLTISLCLTLLLFFMVFRHLPNRRVEARAILPEVVFSALLWMAGNLIFRFLAPSWSLQKIYGPFFVSVTLLLWAYAFGCILLGSARLSKDGFFGDWASETQPLEIPPPIVSNGLDVKVEAPEDEELPFP